MKIFNSRTAKFVHVFLIFIAFTIIIISCEERQKPDNEKVREKMLAHIIPLNDAIKLYNNYSNERIAITKDTLHKLYGPDFNDTRTVWFDLETIKSYITYIEKKSTENNVETGGLKFYFSVHPNDSEKLGKQKNHQTFFIAPTTLNEKEQSGYTLETSEGKEHVLFLKNVINKSIIQTSQNPQLDKASFFTSTIQVNGGLLLNGGQGNPPPSDPQ